MTLQWTAVAFFLYGEIAVNLILCIPFISARSIMRRVVTLLNQVAVTLENSAGLQAQMDSAVKAAKQHQEDNLMLKQALLDDEKAMSSKNQQLKLEVEKLAGQLRAAEAEQFLDTGLFLPVAVHKSRAEVDAMKRQAKGLAQEYDRLLREHNQLQSAEDKKDQ
ncbi:hypothetical protein F2P81_006593 [Scophthalmus maximus]|uniref:Endoplasmic reticulum transmembrane protein n=1 Tax=Scophthalmus maximus TaxID=52904 RepID=A0A6A4T6B6_SCOMX|nr:hypothetical protein F2P81_006593 [Scophthalmus maximus]